MRFGQRTRKTPSEGDGPRLPGPSRSSVLNSSSKHANRQSTQRLARHLSRGILILLANQRRNKRRAALLGPLLRGRRCHCLCQAVRPSAEVWMWPTGLCPWALGALRLRNLRRAGPVGCAASRHRRPSGRAHQLGTASFQAWAKELGARGRERPAGEVGAFRFELCARPPARNSHGLGARALNAEGQGGPGSRGPLDQPVRATYPRLCRGTNGSHPRLREDRLIWPGGDEGAHSDAGGARGPRPGPRGLAEGSSGPARCGRVLFGACGASGGLFGPRGLFFASPPPFSAL